jgi:signal transduction histidine kinase/CheY-like chemotaxis protein
MSRDGNVAPERAVSRYAAVGMALIALAGAALALTVFTWDHLEKTTRFDMEAYHLRSTSVATRLGLSVASALADLHEIEDSDNGADAERRLHAELAAQQVMIDDLLALQRNSADSDLLPAVEAVDSRYQRVTSALDRESREGADRNLDLPRRMAESLALAVEQLWRLHAIETNRHLDSMSIRADDRNRTLALVAVLSALAMMAIGFSALRMLRRTMARESALQASVERARQNQQRALKMEALGKLAGGVAHDFNNLLSIILGHSELMRSRLDRDDPLVLETDAIEQAVSQAAALTRQLLTFSRQQPSEPKPIDLNELTRGMELLLSRLLGNRSELVTMLAPNLGKVRADPQEIERVLINLVSNAADAMPTGGTVTVETDGCPSELKSGAAAGSVPNKAAFARLSVCDIGIGMDETTKERVFEPFFTTKSEQDGTGLGLATVHGIITKAGGWVEIESEVDMGTRIDLYLPRCEPESQENLTPTEPAGSPVSGTILVVDDEAGIRTSCARTLREAGYVVLESSDGIAALELCREHQKGIDLILTDVAMPGMTGPQLAERAKSVRPEAHILFMSGHAGDKLPEGIHYLGKPFSRAELLSHVQGVLGS